jgi:WD40 repeat protein
MENSKDFRVVSRKSTVQNQQNYLHRRISRAGFETHCLLTMYVLGVVITCLTACTPVSPSPMKKPSCLEISGNISNVALSPERDYLAVLTNEGVYLYRQDTFQQVWFAPYQGGGVDVTFSSNGELIAAKFVTGVFQSSIVLWDVATGQLQRSWEDKYPMSESTKIVFNPKATMLASGRGGFNAVALWDVNTGNLLRQIGYIDDDVGVVGGSTGPVKWEVAWSPNDNEIAFGSFDGRVIVWDIERDQPLHLLEGHQRWVWDLAFSPDGSKLASRAVDQMVILWDMATGKQLHILSHRSERLRGSVAWSLDGSTLASSIEDKTVTLWDVETGDQICTLEGHTGAVLDKVAFNSNGLTLVSASVNEIIEWDVETCKQRHTAQVCSVDE